MIESADEPILSRVPGFPMTKLCCNKSGLETIIAIGSPAFASRLFISNLRPSTALSFKT